MRTKRVGVPHAERGEVLEKLAMGRSAAVRVITVSKNSGPEYKAASQVLDAIDDLLNALSESKLL